MDFKLEGINEVQKMMKKMGNVPQQAVSKASRAGIKIVRKAAISNAPVLSGTLRESLHTLREKGPKGKSIYQVVPSASFNDRLVKFSREGKRSYYPTSQEYGFDHVSGVRVEGKHYLRRALSENKEAVEKKILDTLKKELAKAMAKGR
jgi:HK97 gp10 family phage protein